MSDQDSFEAEIEDYLNYLLTERSLTQNTLSNYRRDLRQTAATLSKLGRTSFAEATYPDLQSHLNELRHPDRIPKLSATTVNRRAYALRAFYKYLAQEGYVEENEALKIEPMKTWKVLPEGLTVAEVDKLLTAYRDRSDDPLEARSRAILETLYATGLRVSELTGLKLEHARLDVGYLRCDGKGNKQRLVPIGEWAVEPLRHWIEAARPVLAKGDDDGWLFVNRGGGQMTRQQVWSMIKKTAKRAGIRKKVSPHTFRHAFATHLLRNGMDLRALREALGHDSIVTTELYTKVDTDHIREAHRAYHPRG